jgi:hypothetical protein
MSNNPELDLIDAVAECTFDPLRYALLAFDWNKGSLAQSSGPRPWQRDILQHIGKHLRTKRGQPCRIAVSSGHGIGKSALVAMVLLWGLSTCPQARATITANTEVQLRTKTRPELSIWLQRAINAHWFDLTGTTLAMRESPASWRADLVPWTENNAEAFQGMHNQGSRIILIFDEASAIADTIWEAAEGAQTDTNTEIIWLVFGNPLRSTGRFRECFGQFAHRWKTYQIDARQVDGTNKEQFQEWVDDWGEDSDFVRTRVRGMFPRAGDASFIDSERVAGAMSREVRKTEEPLVMGVDLARGGSDRIVIAFRRGLDARSIPWRMIPGEKARDSTIVVAELGDIIRQYWPDVVYIDETGGSIGGPMGDQLRNLVQNWPDKGRGVRIIGVQFGGESWDAYCENMRACIWSRMRSWLADGAVPRSPDLEQDLTQVGYGAGKKSGKLILESKESMKKRGLRSPDEGDALALTFSGKASYAQLPREVAIMEEANRITDPVARWFFLRKHANDRPKPVVQPRVVMPWEAETR